MEWQPYEGFANVAEQIEAELQAIFRHLGRDAREPFTDFSSEVNRDGLIQFVTTAETYTLAGDFAVRFQPLSDGMEDVTYWQDGVQIKHLIGPTTTIRERRQGGSGKSRMPQV